VSDLYIAPAGCVCDPPSHSGHYSYCTLNAFGRDEWDLLNARMEPLKTGITFDEGIAHLKYSSQEWREITPRLYEAYSPGQTTGIACPSYHLVPAKERDDA